MVCHHYSQDTYLHIFAAIYTFSQAVQSHNLDGGWKVGKRKFTVITMQIPDAILNSVNTWKKEDILTIYDIFIYII